MKTLGKIGLLVLFTIIVLLITGCPGPFSTVQDINDKQGEEILDIWTAVTALESRMDTAESEINNIQAWMIETDETLADYLILIGNNTAAITQVAEDLEELTERSDANDASQQAQINRLKTRLNRAFRLILRKHREVMNRIDDVIDQANADRREYRRKIMRTYMAIRYNRMQIMRLRNAFEEAAEDFQNQLDAINDDIIEIKTRLTDAIEELQSQIDDINIDLATKITLVQSEMETYRILFGDIAFTSEGEFKNYYRDQMYWGTNFQGYNRVITDLLYQIAWGISHEDYTPPAHIANAIISALRDYYVSKNELEIELNALELSTAALEIIINNLPADPVNWAGVFPTLGDVAEVETGNMLYTIEDSTLWIVINNDGLLQLMSVARPGGTIYYNL